MKNQINNLKQRYSALRYRYLDNFVFIHINKTGGSSIEKALKIPFEHKTALEKIDELGLKNWRKRLSFAVVRNPWDKVVSHYHYRVLTNQTNLRDNPVDFNDWVLRAYGEQDPIYYDNPKMFMPQSDWVSDENGKLLIDEVIYFEKLSEEFERIAKKIGKDLILPHVKKSKHKKYKDYYNKNAINVVQKWFARDIENFKYRY